MLPMPISPVAMRRKPSSARSYAMSAPACTASTASARLMAGPCAMECVPRVALRTGTPGTSRSIPMSKGRTSAWATRAMTHTLEEWHASRAATLAVTSAPVCVTPSATTPLSAHITATQRGASATSALPWMPAMCSTAFSSAPRLPSGLATRAQRACASCAAPSSSPVIRLMMRSSSMRPALGAALFWRVIIDVLVGADCVLLVSELQLVQEKSCVVPRLSATILSRPTGSCQHGSVGRAPLS